MSSCIHVCIHTLLSSSQLQGLEDSNILLEHNDVWSCQTPNHNRPETGGVDGFHQPFSKSLARNVLVEYAVLVSQLLVEVSPPLDARLQYKNHRNSFTWVYTLDLYSWRTNRSNWSYSSSDRSLCPNDSKALCMSSSQAIHNLKHQSLVLPANRPERSIYIGDIIGNLSGAADWYTANAVPWRVFIPKGVDSRNLMLSNANQTNVSFTSHGGRNTAPNESIFSRTAFAMPVSISMTFP